MARVAMLVEEWEEGSSQLSYEDSLLPPFMFGGA